jgi:hypothetical protein
MKLKEHIPHIIAEHKKSNSSSCCNINCCNNYIRKYYARIWNEEEANDETWWKS